jgi:predicted Fe-Mo cluster-binding NifX family protein
MKIGFPVQQDAGLDSVVYNHFGSAPLFIVVNTDEQSVVAVANRDQHHVHGACNPTKALGDHKVEAIIVGGIGAGALSRLNQMGITVYRAEGGTVKDNLMRLTSTGLPQYSLSSCCGGHGGNGHGGDCSHH